MQMQQKNAKLAVEACRAMVLHLYNRSLEGHGNGQNQNHQCLFLRSFAMHDSSGKGRQSCERYREQFRDISMARCLKRSHACRAVALHVLVVAVVTHEKMDGQDPDRDKSELVRCRTALRRTGNREKRAARNGAGVNKAVQHRNALQKRICDVQRPAERKEHERPRRHQEARDRDCGKPRGGNRKRRKRLERARHHRTVRRVDRVLLPVAPVAEYLVESPGKEAHRQKRSVATRPSRGV